MITFDLKIINNLELFASGPRQLHNGTTEDRGVCAKLLRGTQW